MLLYIGIAVVVIIIVVGFVYSYQRKKKIEANGVEADAVLSRIKENEGEDADGDRTVEYVYYVQYLNDKGETVEAKLGNPPQFITVGTKLRIKYLPEKPKYALMVK